MQVEFNEFGFDGENNSRLIYINIEENLRNKNIWIEFQKPRGHKQVSEELSSKINEQGVIEYYLKSDLLDEVGYLKIQVVASEIGFIKKSKIYEYYISKSINATECEVDETPSIIDKLNVIIINGDGNKVLADDGIYKAIGTDIDVKEFQSALEYISGFKIGYDCQTINEVLKQINSFYEEAKIVVYVTDSVSGASLNATITVVGATKADDGYYYLPASDTLYTMMITCTGYITQRNDFIVTSEDAKAGEKEFNIAMVARE